MTSAATCCQWNRGLGPLPEHAGAIIRICNDCWRNHMSADRHEAETGRCPFCEQWITVDPHDYNCPRYRERKTMHTPGPWDRQQCIRGDGRPLEKWDVFTAEDKDEEDYCLVIATIYSSADAKLIAAAPDLLAACKGFVAAVEAGLIEGVPDMDASKDRRAAAVAENIRRAIAKAE